MKAAVFFERDGVLNSVRIERRHQVPPTALNDFKLVEQAIEPLRQLRAAGLILLVATNQPGISRGQTCRRELDRMHDLLKTRLNLHDVLVCPHDEMDQCQCRKPRPGLLMEGAFKWHLDLDRSYVISDKWQDAQAAHVAGCTSLLIRSPWNGSGHHDFILSDLASAARKVLQLHAPEAVRYRNGRAVA